MKKLITLLVMAVICLTASAQIPEKFTIGTETYNTEKGSDSKWVFTAGGVDVTIDVGNRKFGPANEFDGCNFKNTTKYALTLPEGMKVYRIQMIGYAQGTNFSYLCAYGAGEKEGYEWYEPLGNGVKRNSIIQSQCKYPIESVGFGHDDAQANAENKGQATDGSDDPSIRKHTAAYLFADIDFGNDPYTDEFPFYFAGNQQEYAKIILYTTRAAADAATTEISSAGGSDTGIELSWDTMLKNETGDNTADQNNIKFLDANGNETGFILQPTGGRAQALTEREGCTKVLNFKNNTKQNLIIPEGTSVYKINFYGWSQGDNWTYIYAYGVGDKDGWEWVDAIGNGEKDNNKIIENATYPIDPCVTTQDAPIYHNAGYCFASIDFGNDPYTGEFPFQFSGNNQERAWIVVYTSKEAAAAAPAAEAVKIGKENSQKNFITNGISTPSIMKQNENAAIYNMAGQRVDASYKGLVIKNGKKYIVK